MGAIREYKFISGPQTSEVPAPGTPSAASDVVTKGFCDSNYVHLTNPQTVENKTLTNPVTDEITFSELSEKPATPATGYKKHYDKTDGKSYTLNSEGVEVEVGSGAGTSSKSSEINYVKNPDGEIDVANWTASGSNFTVSRTTATGEILRGTASIKLSANASTQVGDIIDCALDPVAPADTSKRMSISFECKGLSNYQSGDIDVVLVEDPSGTPVEIVPSVTKIPSAGTSIFKFQAYVNLTTATSYALRFKAKTAGSTRTYDLAVDSIEVGPEEVVQTVPITDGETFVPVFGSALGTVITDSAIKRRVGNYLHISFSGTSGTATSATVDMTIPDNLTLDSTKLQSGTGKSSIVGQISINGGSTSLVVAQCATSLTTLYFTAQGAPDTPVVAATAFGNNARFTFTVEIPIAQWAGSSVGLANSRVEYAYNSGIWDADDDLTSFAYGPAGMQIAQASSLTTTRIKRVRFTQPIKSISMVLSVNNGPWLKVSDGILLPSGNIIPELKHGASANLADLVGIGWKPVAGSTNEIDVVFGHFASWSPSGGVYSWPSVIGTDIVKWCAVNSSNPQSIGVAQAEDKQAGAAIGTNSELGLKQYAAGNTYNGVELTVTGTSNWVTQYGKFIPYKVVEDGLDKWRLKLWIRGNADAGTSVDIDIPAVVWKDYATNLQFGNTYVGAAISSATTQSNNQIHLVSAAATNTWLLNADFELAGKPTWCD